MLAIKPITNRLFISNLPSIKSLIRNKCSAGVNHTYRWNDILLMANINETIGPGLESTADKSQSIFKDKNLIKMTDKGIFILMPFLVRAIDKLIQIINQEMIAINAQKLVMPTLVNKQLWVKSDRWAESGAELFRLKDRHNDEFCLAPTHEEVVTYLMSAAKNQNLSESQLPVYLYQITSKFRDEMRAKHGLLRAREFVMKDLYTFDCNEEEANKTYSKVCNAYERLFKRLDLPVVKARGSVGSIGGKFSDEYLLVSDLGEDQIYSCNSCKTSFNAELLTDQIRKCLSCNSTDLTESNAIEVGHAFLLGNRYSQKFNATFTSSDSENKIYEMGCYGLGVSRILAASVEVFSQNNSIRWPLALAPFKVCVVIPKKGSKEDRANGTTFSLDFANILVDSLNEDVLIDDRTHLTIGKRLLGLKSLGIPYIVIAGKRIIDEIPKFEMIDNYNDQNYLFTQLETIQFLEKNL